MQVFVVFLGEFEQRGVWRVCSTLDAAVTAIKALYQSENYVRWVLEPDGHGGYNLSAYREPTGDKWKDQPNVTEIQPYTVDSDSDT